MKKRRIKRIMQIVVIILFTFSTLFPVMHVLAEGNSCERATTKKINVHAQEVSAQASDAQVIGGYDNFVKNDDLVKAEPTNIIPLARSHQAFGGGGSKYNLVSRNTVSLKFTNTAYAALMNGGLAAIHKGAAIAGVVAQTFDISYVKKYSYMRQSIYRMADKNYVYYKVVDEFSNNKNNFSRGSVKTTYSKVKK
ncbi:hypothetical protein [Listeria kieliensis]|uniref:Uncharacterized protein n=1 Tax=Listeria kieliensis TaxID=1621700 RepID=A0A3D8TPJ1_9LIST|nr:hypothetical protein [Listeria kieliensis]RDX00581.1 hypothetical protein UR08_06170 [Listeria kieliensis]